MPFPQHRVFRKHGSWYYCHYQQDAPDTGPYKTRAEAMEALLKELGFAVEKED